MTLVLGIDPGLRLTGYALLRLPATAREPSLVEAGVFKLDAKLPLASRLRQLHEDLSALLDESKPDVVAVEKLYAHYAHPTTAILMGHARGVLLLGAASRDLPVVDMPSTEVKRAVTGNGHAGKAQVQRAVMVQCGLSEPPSPPDVADAIAIGLAHARRLAHARGLSPFSPKPRRARPGR